MALKPVNLNTNLTNLLRQESTRLAMRRVLDADLAALAGAIEVARAAGPSEGALRKVQALQRKADRVAAWESINKVRIAEGRVPYPEGCLSKDAMRRFDGGRRSGQLQEAVNAESYAKFHRLEAARKAAAVKFPAYCNTKAAQEAYVKGLERDARAAARGRKSGNW